MSCGFELGNLRPRCLDVVPGDGLSYVHVRSQKGPFCNRTVHSLGQNPGVPNTSPSAPPPTVLQWGLSFRHPSWGQDTFRTQQILTQDSGETKAKGTPFFPQMAKLWRKMWSWRISPSCHICFLPNSNHLSFARMWIPLCLRKIRLAGRAHCLLEPLAMMGYTLSFTYAIISLS